MKHDHEASHVAFSLSSSVMLALSCSALNSAEAALWTDSIQQATLDVAADFIQKGAASSNLGFAACQLRLQAVKVGSTGSACLPLLSQLLL